MQPSARITEMNESATIKMDQLARDLKAKGQNVISLSLGEPDFDTPDYIKEAAWEALKKGHTKYTPVPGKMELREAIARKFREENGLHYTPEQIVVSNGAKQSIANVCLSMLNPGDEVILFSPYWVSYFEIVRLAGAKPVELFAGIENDYKVSPEQLEEAINNKTRLIIFSSPCNPTGSVFSEEELKALSRVILSHPNLMVLSDEIYEYINFTGKHSSIGSFDGMAERAITVNGFSKGFAMTGWRLGYMGAPLWLAKACAKMQGQFTSGANAFSQMAAVTALTSDMQEVRKMREVFAHRKEVVLQALSAIPGLTVNQPKGAFYVFAGASSLLGKKYKGSTINSIDDFCLLLLEHKGVALVPGSAFGADNYLRISYAASESELLEACSRIEAFIKTLR